MKVLAFLKLTASVRIVSSPHDNQVSLKNRGSSCVKPDLLPGNREAFIAH